LRHSHETKYVGSINKQLTTEEKLFIQGTCFDWFTLLKKSIKISMNLH